MGRKPVGFARHTKGRGKGKVHPVYAPSGYRMPVKRVSIRSLREFHERRSEKAKETDEALEARPAPSAEEWMAHPEQYDIQGVDHFPTPLARDNFDLNARIFLWQMSDAYDVDMSKVKWRAHNTLKSFGAYYHGKDLKNVYGYYSPITNTFHIGPKGTRLITRGRITNTSEFYAFQTMAHEIAHAVGSPPSPFPKYFDEGCTDIIAQRFVLNNVQMDRKVRRRLTLGLETRLGYPQEVRIVGYASLLAADGNPNDAIAWIHDLYFGPTPKRLEARRRLADKLFPKRDWEAEWKKLPQYRRSQYYQRARRPYGWSGEIWMLLGLDKSKYWDMTPKERVRGMPRKLQRKIAIALFRRDKVGSLEDMRLLLKDKWRAEHELSKRLRERGIRIPDGDHYWATRAGWFPR